MLSEGWFRVQPLMVYPERPSVLTIVDRRLSRVQKPCTGYQSSAGQKMQINPANSRSGQPVSFKKAQSLFMGCAGCLGKHAYGTSRFLAILQAAAVMNPALIGTLSTPADFVGQGLSLTFVRRSC